MPVSKDFVLAGRAVFTVATPDNGHRTFKVKHVSANGKYDESWFVKVLTGPDNTSDYAYVGKLDPFTGQVNLTSKSRLSADSYTFKLLNRILARVWSADHVAYERHGFKTYHMGKCGRCGRALTVPESIERGIGPECATKL